jgi:cytidine deaminase
MAYAPHSRINVGAGLYCGGRKIFTGANVENSSYSLSMCAERVALFKAVSEGVHDFRLLLVYSPQVDFITPCGACLQVLSEFAPDLVVVSMNKHEEFQFYPLTVLMPKPFRLSQG